MADFPVCSPIYFIRHGETDWNRAKKFQGHSDIPLNDKGRKQAKQNGNRLADHLAEAGIDTSQLVFVSSPLSRAVETTEIILQACKLQPDQYRIDNTLKELSFGLFEGLTSPEAKEKYYTQRQQRRKDRWSIAPPEGESFASRVDGLRQFLSQLEVHSVIISHSGIMRIIHHLLNKVPPGEAVSLDISNEGVSLWDGKTIKCALEHFRTL